MNFKGVLSKKQLAKIIGGTDNPTPTTEEIEEVEKDRGGGRPNSN